MKIKATRTKRLGYRFFIKLKNFLPWQYRQHIAKVHGYVKEEKIGLSLSKANLGFSRYRLYYIWRCVFFTALFRTMLIPILSFVIIVYISNQIPATLWSSWETRGSIALLVLYTGLLTAVSIVCGLMWTSYTNMINYLSDIRRQDSMLYKILKNTVRDMRISRDITFSCIFCLMIGALVSVWGGVDPALEKTLFSIAVFLVIWSLIKTATLIGQLTSAIQINLEVKKTEAARKKTENGKKHGTGG